MVSKLLFKGDKKNQKRRKGTNSKKLKVHESSSRDNLTPTHFMVNGEPKSISEINVDDISTGWTTLLKSDLPQTNIPLLISFMRNETSYCISTSPVSPMSSQDVTISSDLGILSPSDSSLYLPHKESLKNPLNFCQPNSTLQVLVLVDVTGLFKNNNKLITNDLLNEKKYALKTSTNAYLSHDPNTHELTLSSVLTLNEMFSLKFEEDSTVSITVGNESDNKLIVTDDLKIKVIKDDEDLLNDLNSYIIRIQSKDSNMTKEILKTISDSHEFSGLDVDDNIAEMKIVRDKVLELSKLGIKITDRILTKLKRAVREGRVNQFMIDIREKKISDRRV